MRINAEKEAALSLERARELLDYDRATGVFTWKVSLRKGWAGKVAGKIEPDGYRTIKIGGYNYRAHRLAWFYCHGVWPAMWIDHKDSNRDNNSIENLRLATGTENQANKIKSRGRFLKGVFKRTDRTNRPYVAQLRADGKLHCLGLFATELEAHQAYVKGAEKHFGDFARPS